MTAVLLASAICMATSSAGTAFYVAPDGNDRWSGRLADPGDKDGPFATLARARDTVRALLKTNREPRPISVVLRGGVLLSAGLLVLMAQWVGKWSLAREGANSLSHAIATAMVQSTAPLLGYAWLATGLGISILLISAALGIFVGGQIPASNLLDFILPLVFIALVVPALKDRAGVAAAVAAGLVGLLAFGLPYKTGLMLAALIGILAGLLVEGRNPRLPTQQSEEENDLEGNTK